MSGISNIFRKTLTPENWHGTGSTSAAAPSPRADNSCSLAWFDRKGWLEWRVVIYRQCGRSLVLIWMICGCCDRGRWFFHLYRIVFNRQREKIWMIATSGQWLETLNPQAYSTCRAPIPKHAQGVMNAFHWELWIFTGNKRSMAGWRRMGFQSVLFFSHRLYLHIHAPILKPMPVPWPSQDWVEVTMPSKSWDFFDPATNIHWHLLWDKVIWMVSPQHVHPQHTNLGCPKGFFVDSKFSHLRSWLQTNLGGSWRCCERGMPFGYWKWCVSSKLLFYVLYFAFLSQTLGVFFSLAILMFDGLGDSDQPELYTLPTVKCNDSPS